MRLPKLSCQYSLSPFDLLSFNITVLVGLPSVFRYPVSGLPAGQRSVLKFFRYKNPSFIIPLTGYPTSPGRPTSCFSFPTRTKFLSGFTFRPSDSLKISLKLEPSIHKILHDTTWIINAIFPHYGHWQVVGIFINLSFYSWEWHPVVSSHNHQCIVEFSFFFQ